MKKASAPIPPVLSGIALFLAPVFAAQAATGLFIDDFTAGGANHNGWYSWNSSGAGTAWDVTTVADSPLLAGKVLRNPGGAAANSAALRSFASVTLNRVNDFVSVSLDVRSNGINTGKQLEIGFYNLGEAISANSFGGANPINARTGYTYGQYFGGANVATYALRSGGTASDSFATAGIDGAAFTDGTDHRIVFTLLRTAEGLNLSTTFDGVVMESHTLSSVAGAVSVDTLRLFTGGIASHVYFDNIQVTAGSIPEPGAAAAWGGGLAFAVCAASRRPRRGAR